MEFTCVECQTVTKAEIAFQPEVFVCPNCRQSYFWSDQGFRLGQTYEKLYKHTRIPVGSKGKLKGRDLTVSGSVTKRVYGEFFYEEYTLVDEKGEFFYLSQSEGHFIFLEEIEAKYPFDGRHTIKYEDLEYRIYDKPKARIADAQGFFDERLPSEEVKMHEYIAPPYIISIERFGKSNRYYKGEHISRSAVKSAFANFTMPHKSGVGITQPFPINFVQMLYTFCITGLIICVAHYFIYKGQSEQTVLSKSLSFQEFDGKEFTSPSFELVGESAPLSIAVDAPVDNSWANLNVTLVDEKTSDETNASKDVEYYHGYTDGESWSEGSQNEDFNICGVPAGKYHLVLSPMKEVSLQNDGQMVVKVVWNRPSTRNIWFIVLFMAIFSVVVYFIRHLFEKKRWSESDYSEYE